MRNTEIDGSELKRMAIRDVADSLVEKPAKFMYDWEPDFSLLAAAIAREVFLADDPLNVLNLETVGKNAVKEFLSALAPAIQAREEKLDEWVP